MNKTLNAIDNSESFNAIKEAHQLNCEAEKLEQYYDKWSSKYDSDVSDENYSGPKFVADYLADVLQNKLKIDSRNNTEIEILDAGCGTGLVGIALKDKGFQNIDGFDLSHKMVEIANQSDVYRSLRGGCDMTTRIEAYEDEQYQVIVCCGVFTLGHVPPTSLEELIRITKKGGLLLVSTRKSYYDSSDFQIVCDSFQEQGKFTLIDSVMDGPYIAEEGAHYWAFVIS
ncbi:MAG: class I SAM-dependent methyltransferase [Cyanobacteria bacterium J06633_8]